MNANANGNGKAPKSQRDEGTKERRDGGTDRVIEALLTVAAGIPAAALAALRDGDPTPYVVVANRGLVSYAQRIWHAVKSEIDLAGVVRMDVLPDHSTGGREVVLLFTRLNPQSAIRNPQSGDPQSKGAS